MGEAKRRREAHKPPSEQIADAGSLDAMRSEGQGIYTLGVYTAGELLALSARVDAGIPQRTAT